MFGWFKSSDDHGDAAILQGLAAGRVLQVIATDTFPSFSGASERVEVLVRAQPGGNFAVQGEVLETEPGVRAESFRRLWTEGELKRWLAEARSASGTDWAWRR